ncbi:predicted protein [Chaetoceros tenuissimus]|uniref:Uncharacterized protein n=1 Tax=Chaetoceros tenuissimus TaxID=426638 RepID=A0AAD3D7V9_9STRA|nr:predicted protein [Chaetoceros tenuissimus]
MGSHKVENCLREKNKKKKSSNESSHPAPVAFVAAIGGTNDEDDESKAGNNLGEYSDGSDRKSDYSSGNK